jgi:hypothetical protein
MLQGITKFQDLDGFLRGRSRASPQPIKADVMLGHPDGRGGWGPIPAQNTPEMVRFPALQTANVGCDCCYIVPLLFIGILVLYLLIKS